MLGSGNVTVELFKYNISLGGYLIKLGKLCGPYDRLSGNRDNISFTSDQ